MLLFLLLFIFVTKFKYVLGGYVSFHLCLTTEPEGSSHTMPNLAVLHDFVLVPSTSRTHNTFF
jgi:hypothetical protein